MKLAICTFATKHYCYALSAQMRRVVANLQWFKGEVHFFFVGDESEEVKKAFELYEWELTGLAQCALFPLKGIDDTKKNYKEEAQILIARLQSKGFDAARREGVDFCWSLESDVLPPANALTCMLDALNFDTGYYDVAMVTYPSQGGGGFLGGRGTPRNPIAECFLPSERKLSEELQKRVDQQKKEEAEYASKKEHPPKEWIEASQKLYEEVKQCPPNGNVWKVNSEHGWRPRGWLDNAYPAIGRGAILPSDWVGLGCTLLSKKALSYAHFEGYEGKGTQDLYLCWQRWYPAGIKQCVITHTLCDHVVRARDKDGGQSHEKYILCQAYHETEGECVGHPRVRHLPWYPFDGTDKISAENDGRIELSKNSAKGVGK